jgi:hypothetical protein
MHANTFHPIPDPSPILAFPLSPKKTERTEVRRRRGGNELKILDLKQPVSQTVYLVELFGTCEWKGNDAATGRIEERRTERSEEPSVLATGVALLENLLHVLLSVLALADLLEGIGRQSALETLQLKCVSCGHQVVIVDGLDKGLDLGSLLLARLGHAPCDLGRVSLDAGDQSVAEGMCLIPAVDGLDDDDLS